MIYLKTGLIPLNLAYDDDIVQEANGLYQLTFKFPKSDELNHLLKEETFLLADDLHGEQEFFVFEVKKSLDHVTVYANQVSTLLNSYAIGSVSVDRVPGQTVMTALAGAVVRACPFNFSSDIAGRHTLNLSHVSVMDALAKGKHSIIGQWGGDLVRDKYSIRLLANGGAENQSLFMYRKNLSQFGQERSIKDLRTRIHFRKVIKGQGEGSQDQVLAVTVDSPLIGQYSQIYEATMTVEDQDVTDEASLQAYGQAYYGKTLCDLPEESMELAVVGEPDTPVRLYDVVSVLYDDYGIDLRLKISKYRYAPMSKRLKSIGFGKVGQTLGGVVGKMVSNQVEEAKAELVDEFGHKLQKEMDNANAAFDAEFDKAKQAIKDGIEEAKAAAEVVKAEIGAEVEAVALEGQAVKQAVATGLAEADRKAKTFENDVRDRVALVETKANQVADQARQADQKAAQALTKAGASETLAQAAKDMADRAIRQAGDNLRTAQERANQLQTELDTTKRTITSQARDILDQAQAQSELTTRLQIVETTANGTKTTVTELSKTLTTATGNLASVTQRVASTETNLAGVRDQYSQLAQTVSGQTGQITAINRQTADLQHGLDGVTERFENLSVGARNFIPDFGFEKNHNFSSVVSTWRFERIADPTARSGWLVKATCTQSGRGGFHRILFDLRGDDWQGKDMTYAVDVKASRPVNLRLGAEALTGGSKLLSVTTEWQRFAQSSAVRYVSNYSFVCYIDSGTWQVGDVIYLRDPQLEEGEIATTPKAAEEDIRQDLATYVRTANENTARLERNIQTTDGKAESARTLAQQTADGLALKAEKTVLDNVTSRLSTAETSIQVQADQIAQRLTSSQVEKAITDKGYQTKDQVDANITGRGYITNATLAGYVPTTTFDNYKTETAQAIERGLKATRALIPTEVGGGNLIQNGAFPTVAWPGTKLAKHAFYFNNQKTLFLLETTSSSEVTSGSNRFPVKRNTDYTLSFVAFSASRVKSSDVWFLGRKDGETAEFTSANLIVSARRFSPSRSEYVTVTFNSGDNDTGYIRFDNNGSSDGQMAVMYFGEVMLVEGRMAHRWTPALEDMVTSVDFNRVKETAELYERVIGRSEGDIQTNVARQVLTSQLYQTEVKSPLADMATRLTQLNDSYAIQVLGSSSRILTEINANASGLRLAGKLIHLDGTVTASDAFFRSVMADKIEAGNIKAGAVTAAKIAAGAVTADHLLVNQAMIDKLVTNSVWADRLFAQSAFMAKLQATKILAGQIDAGLIDTAMLAANAVTADKLLVNQAFFNKLMANEAYLRQLFAKQAFITQVQSVELSASRIKSGILQAINGAMSVNLDSGQILYYTDQAALKRILSGYPTQFIKFATGNVDGKGPAGVTVIGSNRDGSESSNNGGFVGIRAWNGPNVDSLDLVGDEIRLASSAYDSSDGWDVTTLPGRLVIEPHRAADRTSARIGLGDIRIFYNNTTYSSLVNILDRIFDNFKNLNNNGNYQRNFYDTWK